jgi:hypothetical protein
VDNSCWRSAPEDRQVHTIPENEELLPFRIVKSLQTLRPDS